MLQCLHEMLEQLPRELRILQQVEAEGKLSVQDKFVHYLVYNNNNKKNCPLCTDS